MFKVTNKDNFWTYFRLFSGYFLFLTLIFFFFFFFEEGVGDEGGLQLDDFSKLNKSAKTFYLYHSVFLFHGI